MSIPKLIPEQLHGASSLEELSVSLQAALVTPRFHKFIDGLKDPLSLHPDIVHFFTFKDQPLPVISDIPPAFLPKTIVISDKHHLQSVKKQSSSWIGDGTLLDHNIMPTDLGLQLIAAYYGKKYGIEILICSTPSSFMNALSGTGLAEDCKAWGIIVTNGDLPNLHVTPVLCYRNKAGITQIAELDSVCSPCETYLETMFQLQSLGAIGPVLSVLNPRQADFFSCRIDACVILKEALIHLHSSPVDDLEDILMKASPDFPENRFVLPAEWSKSTQITSFIPEEAMGRKIHSKKGELLGDFIKRQSKVFLKQETYHLNYITDPAGGAGSCVLTESATVMKEQQISTFLNLKGKALLLHINQILKEPELDLELNLRFDIIKSLYK